MNNEELRAELEEAVKTQINYKVAQAARGKYRGYLSDGSYYEVEVHEFSVESHDMDIRIIVHAP